MGILPKENQQKGTAPILLLLGGFGLLAFLFVTNSFSFKDRLLNNLFPKPSSFASALPIVFKSSTGGILPTNANGIPLTTSTRVKIELTSTLGSPLPTPTPSPTPSPSPSPTPTPSPSPSPNPDATIDTLDYFKTDHPEISLHSTAKTVAEAPNDQFSETIDGSKSYYIKWANNFYEIHTWDNENIYLKEDHSFLAAGNILQPYTFSHGVWMKRNMKVGDIISNADNRIQRYNEDCTKFLPDTQPYPIIMTLESHNPNYPIGGDLGNQDVIVLKYDWSPGNSSGQYEKFYYSKEWGWVKWELWSKTKSDPDQTTLVNIRLDQVNPPIPPIQPDKSVACDNSVLATTAYAAEASTISYRIAESAVELDNATYIPYTKEPTVIDYTFKNTTLGSKVIWVDFKDSTDKVDRKVAQIELIPLAPTPTPTAAPTSTPRPASTPSPTPSSRPSATPTPIPTIRPTATPQPKAGQPLVEKPISTPTTYKSVVELIKERTDLVPQEYPAVTPTPVKTSKDCDVFCNVGGFVTKINLGITNGFNNFFTDILKRLGLLKVQNPSDLRFK